MKRAVFFALSVALILTLLCGQALAAGGDITIREVKAYSDPDMTNYVGTIPTATSLLVRSYEKYADVYVNGKLVYIDASALLNRDIAGPYNATLKKGTRVYQRATTSAKSVKLKKSGVVNICAMSGDWALVRSTGSLGAFAFVKTSKLTNIVAMD